MNNIQDIDKHIANYPFPAILINFNKSKFRIVSANDAFGQLNNSSSNDICGQDLLDLALFAEDENGETFSDNLRDTLGKVFKTKNPEKVYFASPYVGEPIGNGQATIWLVEIFPWLAYDQKQLILLTLHDISGLSHKNQVGRQFWLGKEQVATRNELQREILNADTQHKALTDELNNFMYSVSHDLRAPLRRIDGFSQELIDEYADQLDETGAHYLQRIRQGAQDMGILIDELLKLSRLSRRQINRQDIDIATIAREVADELYELENDREVSIRIDEDLNTYADPGLIKVVFTNLLSNAFKFTKTEKQTAIKIGKTNKEGEEVFYVKDNGAGFDPDHADQLFKAFSRLHSQKTYSGSGIGLATVRRIISLHGGHIWGEGKEGKGATFYFKFE